MTTLTQFAKRMEKRAAQLETNTQKLLAETVLQTASSVILSTPVDTGRARGSWLPSLNTARTETAGKNTPVGTARINEARAIGKSMTVDDVGVIVNNLPYIQKLNNGSSKQAPAGFVQKAIQTATAVIAQRGATILRRTR